MTCELEQTVKDALILLEQDTIAARMLACDDLDECLQGKEEGVRAESSSDRRRIIQYHIERMYLHWRVVKIAYGLLPVVEAESS